MDVTDIQEIAQLIGSFGLGAVISGGVIYYFLKSYIPSYLAEKGKNLATKEDIESITNTVESVKTEYAKMLEEVKSNNQLKISAVEREKTIKKEVYMDAVEAIIRSQNMIASFSNLEIPEQQLTSCFSEDVGKVAKIQIVGSKKTVRAVTYFTGEIGTATLNLMLARGQLMERKHFIEVATEFRDKSQNEIEQYVEVMKSLNLAGNDDTNTWRYVNESYENECHRRDTYNDEINSLWKSQNKEHREYIRKCMRTFFEITALLPNIVLSVREELDLEIPPEDYLDIYNANTKKAETVFENFLKELEASYPLVPN